MWRKRSLLCRFFPNFRLDLLRYDIVWLKHRNTEDDLRYEAESADDEVEVTVQGIRYFCDWTIWQFWLLTDCCWSFNHFYYLARTAGPIFLLKELNILPSLKNWTVVNKAPYSLWILVIQIKFFKYISFQYPSNVISCLQSSFFVSLFEGQQSQRRSIFCWKTTSFGLHN